MKTSLPRMAAMVLVHCAFSQIVAEATAAGVLRFAFGTPASVTRAGFTKVTVKVLFTPEKGYGFQSVRQLQAFDRGGSRIELPKDSYTASVYGAYRTTSDVTSALVEGRGDNAFLVAFPDGDYTVWVIASDAAWAPPLFEVWVGGQKKLDVRIPRARFVFMEPFEARASGGQLRIEFRGRHGWILSGLMIGKQGPELAEVVAKLDRDVFFLTDQEAPKWKETKYVPTNPPLEFTPQQQKTGYVVFPADYTQQIVPGHVPPRTAIGRPLTALASPGEFEPATFCVSAQEELGEVVLELSDFVGEKGQSRIAREHVSVGVVRCWPQRLTDREGQGEYSVVPEMIEPAFGRCSLDGMPGDGDMSNNGGVDADGDVIADLNGFLLWDTDTIVDEPERWEMTVYLYPGDPKQGRPGAPADSCIADLTPRRCQKFKAQPGSRFSWTNTSVANGEVIQSGAATADKLGLVTLENLTILKNKNRIQISRQREPTP